MTTRRRSVKRRSVWLDTLVTATIATGGQTSVDLMGSWDRDDARGLTVVRTLLELAVVPATPGSEDSQTALDLAIGVVSREAFAAGALPDPNVAGDSPTAGWLWRTRCLIMGDTAGALTPTICRGDFRSMRKLDESGNLFMVLNNVGIVATPTLRIVGIVRQLHLLP